MIGGPRCRKGARAGVHRCCWVYMKTAVRCCMPLASHRMRNKSSWKRSCAVPNRHGSARMFSITRPSPRRITTVTGSIRLSWPVVRSSGGDTGGRNAASGLPCDPRWRRNAASVMDSRKTAVNIHSPSTGRQLDRHNRQIRPRAKFATMTRKPGCKCTANSIWISLPPTERAEF